MNNYRKMHAVLFAAMIDSLVRESSSIGMLMERTGLSEVTTRAYINALKAKRRVFIECYAAQKLGGKPIPFFRFGRSPDATPPCTPGAIRLRVFRQNRG